MRKLGNNVKNQNDSDDINKSKKFVFHIASEHIDFIESLSFQEKHNLINYLITDYRNNNLLNKKTIDPEKIKKGIIIIITILVGIPLIFFLINTSLSLTMSGYLEMQRNFEKIIK